MKCKWLSDDFSAICVNADCPACADACPCVRYPEICRWAEDAGQRREAERKGTSSAPDGAPSPKGKASWDDDGGG